MKKTTKRWLIIAASLVLIGGIIFVGVMSVLKWDFMKLSTVKHETNNYEISEAFDSISVKTDTANIIFAVSDDENCKVECYEEAKAKHSVSVEEGTLVIRVINNKRWYDYIGIDWGISSKVTVYLPNTEYTSLFVDAATSDVKISKDFTFEDVSVSLSTGDVRVENISAGALELSVTTGDVIVKDVDFKGDVTIGVSTGKVKLANVSCKNLTASGKTGDISLDNVLAVKKFLIKTGTGDVKFDSCDAAEICVETKTGDVLGSLLTDKVFVTDVSTGDIDVPKTTTGGVCEIKTGTGDIKMTIK